MLSWFIGDKMVGVGIIVAALVFALVILAVVWLVNRSREKKATLRPLEFLTTPVEFKPHSQLDMVLDEDKQHILQLLEEDLANEKRARARERLNRVALNQASAANQSEPEPKPKKSSS